MKLIATHYPVQHKALLSDEPCHLMREDDAWCWSINRDQAHQFESEAEALQALDEMERDAGPHFYAWYDRANVVIEGAESAAEVTHE